MTVDLFEIKNNRELRIYSDDGEWVKFEILCTHGIHAGERAVFEVSFETAKQIRSALSGYN